MAPESEGAKRCVIWFRSFFAFGEKKKMQENFLHPFCVARGGFEPSTLRV